MAAGRDARGRRGRAARAALSAALALACGKLEGPGQIRGTSPVPPPEIEARARGVHDANPAASELILFGDLHVHTTYSTDAFMMSLPLLQGEGPNPVAAACDYARYCSALDFWSITDHAEGLTPRMWKETKEAIRQCNAVAGDPASPDVVAFLGFEWTQIGQTPADHYGHKNVILHETAEDRVPPRPIHSNSFAARAMRRRPPLALQLRLPARDWSHRDRYFDFGAQGRELRGTPDCPDDVDTRQLPPDCSEGAATPEVLFRKLDEGGYDALVIPHGTTWGLYTPPGSSWDKQLTPAQNDGRQRLIEVYSGHGNSEEYRAWREVDTDEAGRRVCPKPKDGYEPCCWRAGEIIRERCADPRSAECETRVAEARRLFLAAGVNARFTVPGASVADWRDCGTCPDCFVGAYNYRPRSSVQYILSLGKPDAKDADARQFRFGLVASSDNHSARPGTGYKERDRLETTEARGARDPGTYRFLTPQAAEEKSGDPRDFDSLRGSLSPLQVLDFERQASFFLTGGLAAVHSAGRSRDAIWDALRRREVYGTSGPRILLWFDLVNGGEPRPMGSEVQLGEAPRFRVRAAGEFEQQAGCPDWAERGLSAEALEQLCRGECFNPGTRRRRIERIEVVRIRPRRDPGESAASLIEDPWRVLPCPPGDACSVEFDDPAFPAEGRSALYYVRAVQEPTPAVNGGLLRCQKRDANGVCLEVDPCYGDFRTPASDDCLAPIEERAWSSPIFVDPV